MNITRIPTPEYEPKPPFVEPLVREQFKIAAHALGNLSRVHMSVTAEGDAFWHAVYVRMLEIGEGHVR